MIRLYTEFNAGSADDLPPPVYPEPHEHPPDTTADQVIAGYHPTEGAYGLGPDAHSEAHGNHATGSIRLPPAAGFWAPQRYYSIAFHEITHATATPLGSRKAGELRQFGSHDYGTEELCAEIGACYLMAEAGLEKPFTVENSAAYLRSWIAAIKTDRRMVVKAAAAAQKAADHVMGHAVRSSPTPRTDQCRPGRKPRDMRAAMTRAAYREREATG
jgi:antirestriction protein ArdC